MLSTNISVLYRIPTLNNCITQHKIASNFVHKHLGPLQDSNPKQLYHSAQDSFKCCPQTSRSFTGFQPKTIVSLSTRQLQISQHWETQSIHQELQFVNSHIALTINSKLIRRLLFSTAVFARYIEGRDISRVAINRNAVQRGISQFFVSAKCGWRYIGVSLSNDLCCQII